MLLNSVLLAIPSLLVISTSCFAVRNYLRTAPKGYITEGATYSRINTTLTETVEGARTVEALGLSDRRVLQGDDDIAVSAQAERYTMSLRNLLFAVIDVAFNTPRVVTLVVGAWGYAEGWLSLGQITAAVLYVEALSGPLDRLVGELDRLQVGATSTARLLGIAEVPPDRTPGDALPDGPELVGEDLRFAYREGHDVLHGIDVALRVGERLAIVGPSGSGKSTLGRLLSGINRPRTGSARVGGVDLVDLPLEVLRTEVALVTQEHHVFIGTVRDNIVLAREDSPDEAVWAALRAVGSDDWVARLPRGLDTRIGSGQHALTPAQAQQVALARLIIADPHLRRPGPLLALIALPIVVPEIVLAASLVLLFAALGLRLGFAHRDPGPRGLLASPTRWSWCARAWPASTAAWRKRPWTWARGPLRTLLHGHPARASRPASWPPRCWCSRCPIDDYVVTSFVAGVGATTLPVQIYSMVQERRLARDQRGLHAAAPGRDRLLLLGRAPARAGARAAHGRGARASSASVCWARPSLLAPRAAGAGDRVLNLYIWSNYIAPETLAEVRGAPRRAVNLDLYDTNEALLAKVQAGQRRLRRRSAPRTTRSRSCSRQGLLRPLDHSALPHLVNVDPRFLDRAYDPGNRYSVPYFWGTAGIAYRRSRVGAVDSWAALWDPRFRGRILMLDDARETFGAALKRLGPQPEHHRPGAARGARSACCVEQKPLVRAYNSSNFEDVLLSRRRVAGPGLERPVRARPWSRTRTSTT